MQNEYFKFEKGRDKRAKKRILWTIQKVFTDDTDFDLHILMYLTDEKIFYRAVPDYQDRISDTDTIPIFSDSPSLFVVERIFRLNETYYNSDIDHRCIRTFLDILERANVLICDDITNPKRPRYYLHSEIRKLGNFYDMKYKAIQFVTEYFESGKIDLKELYNSPEYLKAEKHFEEYILSPEKQLEQDRRRRLANYNDVLMKYWRELLHTRLRRKSKSEKPISNTGKRINAILKRDQFRNMIQGDMTKQEFRRHKISLACQEIFDEYKEKLLQEYFSTPEDLEWLKDKTD